MSITLTWEMFKWAGVVLFVLSVVGLFAGPLPDHSGSMFGRVLRWTMWPLFLLWIVAFFVRGLVL